jgi:hypothetical protein
MADSYLSGEGDPSTTNSKYDIYFQRLSPTIAAQELGYSNANAYLAEAAHRKQFCHYNIAGGITSNDAGTTFDTVTKQPMQPYLNHRTLTGKKNLHHLQKYFTAPSVMMSSPESCFPQSGASRGYIAADVSTRWDYESFGVPLASRFDFIDHPDVVAGESLMDGEADWMLDVYNGVRRQSSAPIDHFLSGWQSYDWFNVGSGSSWDSDINLDETHLVGGPGVIINYEDNGNYNSQIKVFTNSAPTSGGDLVGVRPRTIAPVRPLNHTWIAEWDGTDLTDQDTNTHPVPPTFVWGSVWTDVGTTLSRTVPGHPAHAMPSTCFKPGPVGMKFEAYMPPPNKSAKYQLWLEEFMKMFGRADASPPFAANNAVGAKIQGDVNVLYGGDNGESKYFSYNTSTTNQHSNGAGAYPYNYLDSWWTYPFRGGTSYSDTDPRANRYAAAGLVRNWRTYVQAAYGGGDVLETLWLDVYARLFDDTDANYIDDLDHEYLTSLKGVVMAMHKTFVDTGSVWSLQWNIAAGQGAKWGPAHTDTDASMMGRPDTVTSSVFGQSLAFPSALLTVTLSKCTYSPDVNGDVKMWDAKDNSITIDDATGTPDWGTEDEDRNSWMPELLSDTQDFGFWKINKRDGAFSNYYVGWYLHPDDTSEGEAVRTMTDLVAGYSQQDTLWRKLKKKEYWTAAANDGKITFNGSHAQEDISFGVFLVTPLRTVTGFTNSLFRVKDRYNPVTDATQKGYWKWANYPTHDFPPFQLYDYNCHKDRGITSTTSDTDWSAVGTGTLHRRSENRYLNHFSDDGTRALVATDAMRYELFQNEVSNREEIGQYIQYGDGPVNSWVEPGQNLMAVDDVTGAFVPVSKISSLDSLKVSETVYLFAAKAGSVGTSDPAINSLFRGKMMHFMAFENEAPDATGKKDDFFHQQQFTNSEDKKKKIFDPTVISWGSISTLDKVFDNDLETRGQAFNRRVMTSTIRKPIEIMKEPYSMRAAEGFNSTKFLDLQWIRNAFNETLFDGLIDRINTSTINFPNYDGWGHEVVDKVENMVNELYDKVKWIIVTILDYSDDIFGYLIGKITEIIETAFNEHIVPWLDQVIAGFIDELGKGKNWMMMLFRAPIPLIPMTQLLLPTIWISFGESAHPTKDEWNGSVYANRDTDIKKLYPKGRIQSLMVPWTFGGTCNFYGSNSKTRPYLVADLVPFWSWLFTTIGVKLDGHTTPFSKVQITSGMDTPPGAAEALPTKIWLSIPQWMNPVNVSDPDIAVPGSQDWAYDDGLSRDPWPDEDNTTQYATYASVTLDFFYYLMVGVLIGGLIYLVRSPAAMVPILRAILGSVPAVYGVIQTKLFRGDTRTNFAETTALLNEVLELAQANLSNTDFSKAAFALIREHMSTALEALGAVARALRGKTRGSDLKLLTELTKLSSPTTSELRDALASIDSEK